MVHFYDHIPRELSDWALQQQVFFIASAPTHGKHVNVSPKGLPGSTLSVFSPNEIAYVDATGSGIETISHVYENGRATIMFCSFDKSPRIMRWFCTGRVIEYDHPDFATTISAKMGKEKITGARAVVLLHVWKCQTSCGYAVPRVVVAADGGEGIERDKVEQGPRAYLEDRATLGHWAGNQIEKGTLEAYHQKMNTRSLDGCVGLRVARRQKGEWIWAGDGQAWLRRTMKGTGAMLLGGFIAVLLVVAVNVAVDLRASNARFARYVRLPV